MHPLGHRGGRGVQFLGGLGEAAQLHNPIEGFQLLERHHGQAKPLLVSFFSTNSSGIFRFLKF
jgi:hypothetical protein